MHAKTTAQRQRSSSGANRASRAMPRRHGRIQPQTDVWGDARRVLRSASKAAADAPIVQARLAVGHPSDPYEREADQNADRVAAGRPVGPVARLAEGGLKPVRTREREREDRKISDAPRLQHQAEPVKLPDRRRRVNADDELETAVQRQADAEEEETVQMRLQCQASEEEEEPVQTRFQRQPEAESEAIPARRREAGEEEKVQARQTVGTTGTVASGLSAQIAATSGGGASLPAATRSRMEGQFGSDFSGVRVHTDNTAVQLSRALHAQAFTHGSDIYFNSGRYRPDSGAGRHLLAHELTHVVQQGAAPRSGIAQARTHRTGHAVQRSDGPGERGFFGRIWDATGGRLLAAGADLVWGFLRERAPRLVPLIRSIRQAGIIGFLRERIGGAFVRIFGRLQADNAVLGRLFAVFNMITAQAAAILAGLRAGSCRALFAAIEMLKQAISQAAGDAWNAITDFFRPVGDFFADIWRRFGAPVVDWIRDVAGDVWSWITGLGRSIWSWMAPVREAFSDAWDWLKRQLGIGGEGGNDQGGLVAWIQEKAGEAWQAIRETLAPVVAPIGGVIRRIREILPLDAIVNLRETVTGWLGGVTRMTGRLEQEDTVAEQQASLRDEILPGVLRTIRRLSGGIRSAGGWIAGRIASLAGTVQGFFGGLGRNALLRPVAALLRWVPVQVGRLGQWVGSTVRRLFDFIGHGLIYLSQFIEPVLGTLRQVIQVLGDLAGRLSDLIFGRFWRMIPRCIRDPIKNFIVQRILANIPIFGQLLRIPDIWARVRATALRILRQVFVTGDLPGAAWTFFRAVLGMINIPARLVVSIVGKAAAAIGDILTNPVGFLVNLVRGLVRGVVRFCTNIGRHLVSGISGWLFGQLQEAGIQPPADFSLRSILGFVLQVLDITRERIFRRMERHPRIGRERVARLRRIIARLSGAWEWVGVMVREGPAGLWRMLRERLSNLWQTVLSSIVTWVSTRVMSRALARLATMADPSGIGAVVNIIVTIYQMIQTAAQYARQILEAVDRYLDGIVSIARGAIGAAAGFLERALARLLPAAIGFVANWVGLGGLGRRIRQMIERIRARVDRAIDWLINRGVRVIDAVLRGVRAVGGAIRSGAQRLAQWWRARKRFRADNGEAHTLFFEGENRNARLMIRSERKTYAQFIESIRTNRGLSASDPAITRASETARQIDALRNRTETTAGTRDQTAAFSALLDQLADRTRALLGPTTADGEIPVSTSPEFGSLRGTSGFGTSMHIDVLSRLHPPGSEPAVTNNTWEALRQRKSRQGGRTYYVLGHLLSNRLGGPGTTWQNLSPLRQEDNQNHERTVERPLKQAVDATGAENKVFTYDVFPSYASSLIPGGSVNVTASQVASGQDPEKISQVRRAEQKIPVSFRCHAIELDKTTLQPRSGGQAIRTSIMNRIDTSPAAYNVSGGSAPPPSVNLNTDDRTRLARLPGIGRAGADVLIDLRSTVGPFVSIAEARSRYESYREAHRRTLRPLSGVWPHRTGEPAFVVDVS